MTDITGAFGAGFTVTSSFTGARTASAGFGLNITFGSSVFGATNNLRLTPDSAGTFTFAVDTRGSLGGRALKADGSAGEAYVEFDCSAEPDVWVAFRLNLSAAGLAAWTDPGVGNFAYLLDLSGMFQADLLVIGDAVTYGDYWTGNGGSEQGSVPPPVADTWVDCEFHYEDGGLSEFFIGDVTVWSVPENGDGSVTRFKLGVFGPFAQSVGSVAYFDDVKFGTTRGGSELFADDFSSGNLDAWTTTVGDVSLVTSGLTPATSGSL